MKQYLKFIAPQFIAPLILIIVLLAACEIPRPAGAPGDLSTEIPVPGSPPPLPPATDTPIPAESVTPPTISEISPEVFPAPVEPDLPPKSGQIMVKLVPQAALQARDAQVGSDGIVAAGVPPLDETLKQIGATGLEPVIQPVADGTGDSLENLSLRVSQDVNQLYVVNYDPQIPPQDAAAIMQQDPSVEYAEPNFIAGITGKPSGITGRPAYIPAPFTPNDPYFSYQWHMQEIQAPAAWDQATGQNVIVAVVDTGIDFGAPDLQNTGRRSGYDFVNNDADPTDDQGHGTHVAGTIAQSTNNGVGVAGVAFNTTLLPVKVLDSSGQGSYEKIIQGIIYATDQGAKVINMSLAGRNGSQALQDAVKYAHDRGVFVVVAAGNSNGSVAFPAAYDDYVVAVGAVRFDKTRAPYSNFGPQIDLVAPGGDTGVDQNQDGYADGVLQQTFKRVGGGYTYLFFEGTSMASPHVAGVAALMLSKKPNASPQELETLMANTARNLGDPNQYGAGLIQAAAALNAIGGPVEPPTDTPTPTPLPPIITDTPTPTPLPPVITDTPTPTPLPPIITDTPTPTPTSPVVTPPTDTPTPMPLPPGELLTNGGFETDEGWVFGDTPIRGGYETNVVLSGNRSIRLGALSGRNVFSFSSIWQRVTIPAEASQAVLTANVYPITQDSCGVNLQYIALLNSNFRLTRNLSIGLSNSQTWEQRTYDISDLRGQTIYVYFSVLNRGCSGLTAMYVDDVSLRWGQ
ncbi:MAG: S8 family serine peptidase [Anaerolineae bacterium]|nr:S8 family serine peptidase [Anaerolineae bacterium]